MLRMTFALLCAVAVLAAARAVAAVEARDLWVEVRINGVTQSGFAMLHVDSQGHLYVHKEDMRAWHMVPPATASPAPRASGGSGLSTQDLVRLDGLPGLRARLEADEMVLRIEADPGVFTAQRFDGSRAGDAPQRGVPALFMGYNLFAEHDSSAGTAYSALMQAGSSLGRTSVTSSWLATRGSAVRLDSDLLLDFPEYTARLTLGDSVASPGTLGQSVRFTGIHWATDYATRPGLTPYALPVVSGTATLPSTIDLYVNQALVQRTSVDAGPFELNNIPVPVGQGSVTIRMRDMLGQEQQLSLPYLVAPQLITAGLTIKDFAAGAVRENYGIDSFDYGRAFLSGGVQHGVTDAVTVNTSAELVPDTDEVTARAGAAARVLRNLTVELTPAVSHAAGMGTGAAVDTGIDSVWPALTAGLHFRAASPDFVELGNLAPGQRLRTEWAAQASTQFGRWGSLGLLYAWRRSFEPDASTAVAATLTYNLSLRHVGAVGAFVTDTHGSSGGGDLIVGIVFTHYLGKGVSASVVGTSDNGASTVDMRIGRAAPSDAGWGWELAHARGGADTDGARVEARSAYGSGSGEVDSTPSGALGLVSWQGGFLWAGGRVWPAQTLAGPAALLEVPELAGLEVLHDGQPVGRTDSAGRILVPALRPFENNTITVVPEDLPPEALVDADKVVVRPYSHGVVTAVLGVSGAHSAIFVLRLGNADFVPAGALVQMGGHEFPVGTEGLAQLPVARKAVDGVVSWPGGSCRVRVPGAKAERMPRGRWRDAGDPDDEGAGGRNRARDDTLPMDLDCGKLQ